MKRLLAFFVLAGAFSLFAAPAIGNEAGAAAAAPPLILAQAPAPAPDAKAAEAPKADEPKTDAAPAAPAAAPPAPTEPQLIAVDKINSGDTAWMLTSTALVLLMTIPGLALFYGGMVRKKSVLATLMQSFAITCLVTVLWVIAGYSLAFMPGSPFFGSLDRLFLKGMVFQKEAGKVDGLASGTDDPRIGLHDVPDDVCDHHAGAHLRRVRGPDEVLGDAVVHGPLVDPCLLADRAHDVGAVRLLGDQGRARFRGRHGRSHQRRHRGAGLRAGARQAAGLRQGGDGAAQPRR